MLQALKNNNYNIFNKIIKYKKRFYNDDFSLLEYYNYVDEEKSNKIIYLYFEILNIIIEKDNSEILNIINNYLMGEKDNRINVINHIIYIYIIRKSSFCAPKILKKLYRDDILDHDYANRMLLNIVSRNNVELMHDIILDYNNILELDLNSEENNIFNHKIIINKKSLECIKFLLSKIDIIEDRLLYFSIKKNNIDILKLILNKTIKIDINELRKSPQCISCTNNEQTYCPSSSIQKTEK